MPNPYQKLFEPLTIGKLSLKNRFSMAPLGMVAMSDPHGGFTNNAQEYYVERAKGGTGLIITGVTSVDYNEMEPLALPCASYKPLWFLKTTAPMNERIHAYDARIFLQLTGGFGRVAIPHLMKNAIAPSPQENRWDPSVKHREMTREEIQTLIHSFVSCAAVAKLCHFDGVEIHAVHEGYLLDQFAIALYNKRTDEYGGDLRGRLKLATDVVKGIKAACGSDFPVSLRFSLKSFVKGIRQGALPGEKFTEKGKDIAEGIEAAKILTEAGYDILNVDAGTYDSWYWNHPPMYFPKGMYREFGQILKKELDTPLIVAGRMDDPKMACEALGVSCDLIGLGRPLLADPYLPQKIRTGRLDEIRPCISCQQGCLARLAQGLPLSCAVNPSCGREKETALTPVCRKKNVLIVGGGLAGMEAARVCALRGHCVTLYEKGPELGGTILPGAVPDFKEDDRRLVEWYKTELGRLPVKIKLNCAVTKQTVEGANADAVILATGAAPIRLNFGGQAKIYTAEEILLGPEKAGNDIVVVGGGLVGCETALWLRRMGKNVTVVEATPQILGGGADMCFANYDMLKDLLVFEKIPVLCSAKVTAADASSVTVQTADGEKKIKADTVMLAVGYRPDSTLYNELRGCGKELYNVGDSRHVQNIMHAIWDAFQVAREL